MTTTLNSKSHNISPLPQLRKKISLRLDLVHLKVRQSKIYFFSMLHGTQRLDLRVASRSDLPRYPRSCMPPGVWPVCRPRCRPNDQKKIQKSLKVAVTGVFAVHNINISFSLYGTQGLDLRVASRSDLPRHPRSCMPPGVRPGCRPRCRPNDPKVRFRPVTAIILCIALLFPSFPFRRHRGLNSRDVLRYDLPRFSRSCISPGFWPGGWDCDVCGSLGCHVRWL